MKYEITKEIMEMIGNHVEELNYEIEAFNKENGELFGFNNVIEVYIYKHLDFVAQRIAYEVKINWSCVGAQTLEETAKFMERLQRAKEYADQVSEKLEKCINDLEGEQK